MAVNTLLLDFRLPQGHTHTHQEIETIVLNGFEQEHFGHESIRRIFSDAESLSLFIGPRESLITMRYYCDRNIVTVTIEYYLTTAQDPLLTYQDCVNLERKWSSDSKALKPVKTLPRIIRGGSLDVYFPTSDERLLEYDVEEICFDVQSKFQHVQIFKTKSFGNMLVLDDDPNLAESDSVYTDALMRRGMENYKNSEVLILGGGDGALLEALLQEKPKKVTMLEIDETVMEACRTHLRSLCGTALDQPIGPNHEIITSDCFPIMMEMLEREVQFDYVFGDLTTIPVTPNGSVNGVHSFVSNVLDISFRLLRPTGKFMTHSPGTSGPESAAMLESLLRSEGEKGHQGHSFQISKQMVFVPSFSENWTFYAISFAEKPNPIVASHNDHI